MTTIPVRGAERFVRFCAGAAIALLLCMLVPLALISLRVTVFESVYGTYEESIAFLTDSLVSNLALTALALLALLAFRALIARLGVRLHALLCALWLAAALFWVLGIGLQQEVDCKDVLEAAQLFAQGNYRPMRMAYFSAYPYQLGVCLFMEAVMRLIPGIDINLFMQALNVVLSVGTMGLLSALAETIFERPSARAATQALIMAFLPFWLFNTYVYGTVPMIFLCSAGFFCFARYIRTRRVGFAVTFALCLAAAYAAKPNALIPILALLICSLLDALVTRDVRLPVFALLALLLGLALSRFAVWQYELRSGVKLGAQIGALARLVMGLQESQTCAGWFNGYTAPFIDLSVTAEMQHDVASADLAVRIREMADDPAMAAAFFRDKWLSQWLEPGYSTLWYGFRCHWAGRFNGLAILLYRENSAVRTVVEAGMNVYQQALYILAAIGTAASLRRRADVTALMLPVALLGGFLFHMLFEAKSQYIFVYVVYMMPLAGYGLGTLADAVSAAWRRLRRRAEARA